ncbi:MAG: prolyl oligopeptidase family serine peptidase [Bacteroidetes bacterium]|nr:prolyl oligopeptidase family serine peptidase [Bacteroidota bacterium]
MKKLLLMQVGILCAYLGAHAQPLAPAAPLPAPYQPTRSEVLERYKKAKTLDSLATRSIFKTGVRPHWSADNNSFWYRNIVSRDSAREYIMVDVVKGTRTKLDGEPKDTTTRYTGFARRRGRNGNFGRDSISPDKQWVAFIHEHNVYVRPANATDAEAVALTTDGSKDKPYGNLSWSPDSKYVVGYHITPVRDSEVYYVLSSVKNTTRGQLKERPYKQPGDPFTTYEMFLFRPVEKKATKVNTPIIDFFGAPELHWRMKDNRYFTFERVERGHQRFAVIEVDATTGDSKAVIDDKTKTFIYEQRLFTYYLPETNEMLMTSEKDGWQHIYLFDLLTGTQKQEVTKGNWVVRNIDSIDVKKREIWFSASGMNPEEDPYYVHWYRIGFDGKNLVSLTPAKGNHIVSFSPDRKYYIDAVSEINVPTVTELHRTADGKKVVDLEKADASQYLAAGFKLPEPFHAKGRDGVTDIWGIIVRPNDFDPNKRYPVIENIYAGPQDAFVPKDFTGRYGEMQSIAQMGFIVVQIDGMGTANRSKAFHDVCWKNIADAGFPDRILWMKAMAAKYSYADIDRVGIYGTSAGGQNSLGGLLFHPEFYKVAVSSCGCHDNRIDKQWWNEQWMGYPVGKHYDEQSNVTNAWKLRGDLLLMVGEADNNVPPESTYRVADALIKAGKAFEFLPIPGSDHTDGGPYGRIKRRDFFVRQLLGVEPPHRNDHEL